MDAGGSWIVAREEAGPLAGWLRAKIPSASWGTIKGWVLSGKVRVNGAPLTEPGARLRPGQAVELRMDAPRPRPRGAVTLVHEDAHLVVVDKPAGILSVPWEAGRGAATDLIREAWRRLGREPGPLLVVHRIDKDTSGLLVFAKTSRAQGGLSAQLRAHVVEREYACVAQGRVASGRIESRLVADRGDGLRGSARLRDLGKRAVTHVVAVEELRDATRCEVRLETGRTHQIRIHLAEAGHPLVGERVYVRDLLRAGGTPLTSARLLLHARVLGFEHPVTGRPLRFVAEPPGDFQAELDALRGTRPRRGRGLNEA